MSPSQEQLSAIGKTLSDNDVGNTGGHQAGMYIPKTLVGFFPDLPKGTLNPRTTITCTDHLGDEWQFEFIFYNNCKFGGTRNEYRLTCMTPYFKENNLEAGDQVRLIREEDQYRIEHQKQKTVQVDSGILHVSTSWKVINI